MTTDKTQKLDEALIALAWEVDAAASGYQKNRSKSKSIADLYGDGISEAKQALLDWHNKQIKEVLDRLLEHGEDFTTFGDGSRSVAVEYIEAERNRLKESD